MAPLTRLKFISAGLAILCFLLAGTTFAKKADPQTKTAYLVSGITLDQNADGLQMVIKGSASPIYTMYELFDPLRIVLDIADAKPIDFSVIPANLPFGSIINIKSIALADQKTSIARLEIYLSDDPAYTIEKRGDNIIISFAKESAPPQSTSALSETGAHQPVATVIQSLSGDTMASTEPPAEMIIPKFPTAKPKIKPAPEKLPEPKVATKTAVSALSKKTSEKVSQTDNFGFAGYEKQKITVDFFKIDLHNVFRLFGEISGQNIVVDEGVNGTLTLALTNIPWDFALDIILNLKDLQKEERFNTLVISPKSKQFQWPKATTEAVAFKGGEKLEALSVKQRLETPKGVIEAKNLIQQATVAEKNGQTEKALSFYEAAFNKWPENIEISNRIAWLYLTQMGMNAKAVHYAKATLAREPANFDAALQAAIGSANMKKTEEAKAYFDLAISGEKPTSDALLSYAAFAEEHQSYNGALALLARHETHFGDTLDTLVTRARILDKLGNSAQAVAAYNTVLLSGYIVPEDLQQFIKSRIAVAE